MCETAGGNFYIPFKFRKGTWAELVTRALTSFALRKACLCQLQFEQQGSGCFNFPTNTLNGSTNASWDHKTSALGRNEFPLQLAHQIGCKV